MCIWEPRVLAGRHVLSKGSHGSVSGGGPGRSSAILGRYLEPGTSRGQGHYLQVTGNPVGTRGDVWLL